MKSLGVQGHGLWAGVQGFRVKVHGEGVGLRNQTEHRQEPDVEILTTYMWSTTQWWLH